MKCKCGCEKFFLQKKGSQTGIYCSKCGKWQKWGNKKDIRLIEHKEEINKSETDDTVTITREEYEELLDYKERLECLEAAGVDNWEGYDYAMEMYNRQCKEE